jgi:hypothetical protein
VQKQNCFSLKTKKANKKKQKQKRTRELTYEGTKMLVCVAVKFDF